jgi:serine/threonine protein kinase/tetratricopeptide (TPR) repeat protein
VVPEIGKKYGPYEILGHLGGGGMGFVYRAWDARLHREVAIKLLHSEYTMPGMRERFLREARAASALNHPNICTIFDIGEQNGEPYLVMELLQGQTLKDLIDYRTIQVDELVCIAREIAEALGAAHAKGVIHRDVKPANIFLVDKPNGSVQAKVLDFGLAKFQGGVLGARTNRSLELTAVGATVGTLAYMSPEQARGEVLDSRSDLFSLGVVLYEMSTRHIPFPGATSALVFVQLLNHQPESVRNWNDAIPKELDRIIFKLMSKERTQRFQTAQELEEALARIGEKSAGGWLRKAAASVPLVRSVDPVAREKRVGRKPSDSQLDAIKSPLSPAPGVGHPGSPQPAFPQPTPAPAPPSRGSADDNRMLRPVARIPQQTATPAPAEIPVRPVAALAVASSSANQPVAEQVGAKSDSAAFAAAMGTPYEPHPNTRPEREASRIHRPRFSPIQIAVAVLAILLLAGCGWFLNKRGSFHPALLTAEDSLVLTDVENRTGDRALDGVVGAGLQIALAESPYLRLQSQGTYLTARHLAAPDAPDPAGQVVARAAADKLQSKAYLFGRISGTAPPYLIHVDLLSTASNDILTSVEEPVPSLQQIPAAIDHVAGALRSNIGESSDSIGKFSNPLARESTTNLDALHALSRGDASYASGHILDSLRDYQQAATLEPRFVQAHLRLAVLYRKLRAEAAAADSAKLALAAADEASVRIRTIAQYEYEMNTSGDYVRAASIIKQQVTARPHDANALERLSRALRLQGRVAEALQVAQQAYAEDPFNIEAYTQAENSLIGLDRYEAAAQIDAQAQRVGLTTVGGALTAAYLGGRTQALTAAVVASATLKAGYRVDWNYGIYLDNTGHLAAGADLWRSRAAAATEVKGLESAAAFLLSQGAIDRALLGDCTTGLALAREAESHPRGLNALFNLGMTFALCGDAVRAQQAAAKLQQLFPQSFAVKGFFVADIQAGLALHDQDPAAALEFLKPARQFDLISLTPILRGRAHVALRQVQIGIVDFQTVLSHRGVPFIVGNVSFPVAQIGVARAFADTGDIGNSADAYRRFLDMWQQADAGQPLLAEARAHNH